MRPQYGPSNTIIPIIGIPIKVPLTLEKNLKYREMQRVALSSPKVRWVQGDTFRLHVVLAKCIGTFQAKRVRGSPLYLTLPHSKGTDACRLLNDAYNLLMNTWKLFDLVSPLTIPHTLTPSISPGTAATKQTYSRQSPGMPIPPDL